MGNRLTDEAPPSPKRCGRAKSVDGADVGREEGMKSGAQAPKEPGENLQWADLTTKGAKCFRDAVAYASRK